MTTFTSNNNQFAGKVQSNNPQWTDKADFSERSGCAGYALLFALVAVLGVIVYFIATHS